MFSNSRKSDQIYASQARQNKSDSASKPATIPVAVQTKLNIGNPNDSYEREADKVADKVANQPSVSQQVQTKPAAGEDEMQRLEEEEVRTKPMPIQREPEEEIRAKTEPQSQATAPPDITRQIKRSEGSGSPLPTDIRQSMESGIGADFGKVRIHTDQRAESLSQQLNAQAFTVGKDIYFNKDKYNPSSQSGRHLLAHELTHTVQQAKSLQKMVQRDLVFGDNAKVTGYKFEVGNDLPLPFLELAQRLSGDGQVSSNDLYDLRAWAINNLGTVNDYTRMFMAGFLDETNRNKFNGLTLQAGVEFTFPFDTITTERRNRISNLNRQVDTSAIDYLDYEAKEAMVYEGPVAMGQKLQERDQEIENTLISLAGNSYQQSMTNTIAFAKANNIDMSSLLEATINSASDSTPGDRAMAALTYAVSNSASMRNSSHLRSGKVQVDTLSPSAFRSTFGNKPFAGYSTQGGGPEKTKGDTLYLQNNLDINDLGHRSVIIHEMTHASDDANENAAAAPVDHPVVDLEFKAYTAQAAYILEQVASAAPVDQSAALQQVSNISTRIINSALIYQTYDNKARYKSVLVELLKVQGVTGNTEAKVNNALSVPRQHYKTQLTQDIINGYGLNRPGAQTDAPLDGLAGTSLIDWINRL